MNFGSLLARAGRSFYDKTAYREAARDRTAACIAGLALVIAVVWVLDIYKLRVQLREMMAEVTQGMAGMPDVHLEDGEARLDPPGRFVMELEGKPFMTLDPEMTAEEALAQEEGVFMTSAHVFLQRKGQANTRSFELSALGDRVIGEADLERWGRAFFGYIPFVLYPLAVAFSLAWRLSIATGCAAIGLAIARMAGAGLDYAGCFRIATLALVPTLVIDTVAVLSAETNWWAGWMGAVCTLGFLTFGILANRGQATPATSGVGEAAVV